MLWEVEIRPGQGQRDREAERVLAESHAIGIRSIDGLRSARSFLIEGNLDRAQVERAANSLLSDPVVETFSARSLATGSDSPANGHTLLNVLYKPGVTDNVAQSAKQAIKDLGLDAQAVATCRKYWLGSQASTADVDRLATKVLANGAIEHVIRGPLELASLALGSEYRFQLVTVPIREMNDEALIQLSKRGQLYLSLPEMQTIRAHFVELGREATDIELETIAQTWSEHCSHKTLTGRVRYRDENGERMFDNMLKETIFAATRTIREQLGKDDWCVSVFRDNAGVVAFDDTNCVCFKVETHNHPSALEPYGGANTGLGGVIRDPLGTGLGAKPICNTDVFCFAPPDVQQADLPPGVLHPRVVARGVVSGVRDYGNRMGIPTVNGAVVFDERYLGNPLVYCGNVALIPKHLCEKTVSPGELIIAVGGRTGRDGIHGATFSSAELTHESETLSGGAVQIGNAVAEKMVVDVVLQARDRGLYTAITDCGAGGFSSAVGEMGADCGAEVWLEKPPLKYAGLSYTEVWISEAQERMVLSVPEQNWDEFNALCAAEGVEATVIGKFTDTGRLVLKYNDRQVGELSMHFLHDGRPKTIRDAGYSAPKESAALTPSKSGARKPASSNSSTRYDDDLIRILGSLNVCSKEWIIRQYDHEVQAGSVIKPLVGAHDDGPSDAAVVRPVLSSPRGIVVACGINPRFGDFDPYWMAASAIDEAVRNCVAVGADPRRIAILDNFCWGNTERSEVLGSLVRAAIGCHDTAIAFGTPFISGKDSLNNEFTYEDAAGKKRNVSIPPTLLISALGQIDDVSRAVSMDLKQPGNRLYLVGQTHAEMGGSHFALVRDLNGGVSPKVDLKQAPRVFAAMHRAIAKGYVRACHDLSEGGLAAAAAEMAFAGDLGADINLQPMSRTAGSETSVLLFSESNTRFLVEVPEQHASAFEANFADVALTHLGRVTEQDRLIIRDASGAAVIDSDLRTLKDAWKRPLAW